MFFGKRRKKKGEQKPHDETYVGEDFGFDEELESREVARPRPGREDPDSFDEEPPRREPPRREPARRDPPRADPPPRRRSPRADVTDDTHGRSLDDHTFVGRPDEVEDDSPRLVPPGRGGVAGPLGGGDDDRPDVTVFIGAPADRRVEVVAWLVVASGDGRGRDYRLHDVTTRIGGAPESDIRLAGDEYASTRHAEIRVERGEHVLVDLESTNGTFVNDERVKGGTLADGDRVRFGLSEFVFKCARI